VGDELAQSSDEWLAVGAIVAGTDAAHAALVPVSDILEEKIELAFDHLRIIRDAVERVRVELPPEPRGRARLGDPDRPHGPTRARGRKAG
jgi:hypothetical protein